MSCKGSFTTKEQKTTKHYSDFSFCQYLWCKSGPHPLVTHYVVSDGAIVETHTWLFPQNYCLWLEHNEL